MKNLLINPGIIKRIKTFLTGKYVEDGNTASQNIPAGKWVIWKNQMCQAKTAITTGDTLSSTNLDVQGDDGAVNVLSSIKTESVQNGDIEFHKFGKIVVMQTWAAANISIVIPEGYRPKRAFYAPAWSFGAGGMRCLWIDTNGRFSWTAAVSPQGSGFFVANLCWEVE